MKSPSENPHEAKEKTLFDLSSEKSQNMIPEITIDLKSNIEKFRNKTPRATPGDSFRAGGASGSPTTGQFRAGQASHSPSFNVPPTTQVISLASPPSPEGRRVQEHSIYLEDIYNSEEYRLLKAALDQKSAY